MWKLLLVCGLATVASFLCSAGESAIYSISWAKIETLRKSGKKTGQLLYELRQNIEKPITAILTLNTVAATVGASVAGAYAAELFGEQGVGWFAFAFTMLILVVGEIIPKTIGVVYSRTVATALAWPLHLLVLLLTPFIWLFSHLVRFMKKAAKGPQTTEEDIRALVSLTYRAGVLKPFEELAIRNILSLDAKTVEEIMTPRVVIFSLPAEMTVAQARAAKAVWPHSRIPVYADEDPEEIVGVVYRREVFEALANDQDTMTLGRMMQPVEFVVASMTLDRLLGRFLESRSHILIVLDEFGGVSGLVTLEDVLEELLGKEIVDETDQVVDMRELARMKRAGLLGKKTEQPLTNGQKG